MRSPRAVNRTHTRFTPIHAQHAKGQQLRSLRALHKAIRHTLVNQDVNAVKASLIFGQLDLKLAEYTKKVELSEVERVEKERRAALKKAEKDAQLKAKKDAEQRRKQEKSERKRAELATKQTTVDPKLESVTYIPPTLVVEQSKPLQKNETKKAKKSEKKAPIEEPVEVKEEPIVRIHEVPPNESKTEEKVEKKSKKDKKEKKKSEPENRVDEVKLFEVTATPKNTPIDTPKEAPATPAEYDVEPPQHHQVDLTKAADDEKKQTVPEELSYETRKVEVEEPLIEKVEQVKQETPATIHELNGVHEAPFIADEKEGKGELGEIRGESHHLQGLKDQEVPEKKDESHFKENLKDAGLGPVKHWENADGEAEKEKPQEQKEGLISSIAEKVTNIWEDLTSGKSVEAEETKPDIWEEFTSGKPLFKEETKQQEVDEVKQEKVQEKAQEPAKSSGKKNKNKKNKEKSKKEELSKGIQESEEVKPTETASEEKAEKVEESHKLENEDREEEKEPKEGLISSLAETVTNIWEDLTSGKPLFGGNEEKPVEAKETKPDIWEEFTSGKPLFKDSAPDELPDIPVSDSSKVAEELSKEVEQVDSIAQPIDLWEEFASGKPLFKEEASEQKTERPESQKHQADQSEVEEVKVKAVKPETDIWEEFTSGKPLFKEETKQQEVDEVKQEKAQEPAKSSGKKNKNKKNKEKSGKEELSKGIQESEQVKLAETASEGKAENAEKVDELVEIPEVEQPKSTENSPVGDIWEEFTSGKPIFKNDDVEAKPEATPTTPTRRTEPEEQKAKENKKNKKNKDKRAKKSSETEVRLDQITKGLLRTELKDSPSEISTASMDVNIPENEDQEKFNATQPEIEKKGEKEEPLENPSDKTQPEDETPFISVENKKNKKKDKRSKQNETKESIEPLFNDESLPKLESEAQPHEVTYGAIPIASGDKKNGESQDENPGYLEKNDSSESYELALEKDIFQKLKPAEKHKKSKSPEAENLAYVWDGLVDGVPIIKAIASPKSSPKREKLGPAQEQQKPEEPKEGLISSLAETVTNIWEDLTSGKPLFGGNGEKPFEAEETKPDIWEEFTSGKPLFKDNAPDELPDISVSDLSKVDSVAQPIDLWEEFASGKPLFKEEASEPKTEQPESQKDQADQSEVEEVKVKAMKPETDIWEEFTSGKPLFKEEVKQQEVDEVKQEKVQEKAQETAKSSGKKNKNKKNKEKSGKEELSKGIQESEQIAPAETASEGKAEKVEESHKLENEDREEEKEPKEGLIFSLAETVTNIWEDLTSGKPLFGGNEEKPVEAEETKPDIWEEFTSGKPLFKDSAPDELPDIPVSDSSKVAEELSKEVEQTDSIAQPTDLWEEFASGKPLFKEEVSEQKTEQLESQKGQAEALPEPVIVPETKSENPQNAPSASPPSNPPLSSPKIKEDPSKDHGKKSKKDKKNKKISESRSEVSEPKVEPVEIKVEETTKPVERVEEPVSIQIEEKKDKKKNKKEKKTSESQSQFSPDSGVVTEQVSAPPSHTDPSSIDIWEEFASSKPLFKEQTEGKVESNQAQTSEDITDFPIGHWETPTLELSSNDLWGESGSKKKKHKDEPAAVVSRPSYSTWDEPVRHEKELEKAINVPEPEAPKDIWEEFTSGKPIFKEDNKEGTLVKQVSIEEAIRVPEPDAPKDIWEEFTSGKPLFQAEAKDEEISEELLKQAEEAIEASRKIWAEDQQGGSTDVAQPEPAPVKQESKESKSKSKNKKDKKHKKSESEDQVHAEPVAVKENGHPVQEVQEGPNVAEKKEEPVEVKNAEPAQAEKSKEKKDNKKKNKKGKTNSESEQVIEAKKSPSPIKEVPKPVEEIVLPEPVKVESVSTPSPTNNGSSKNKKKNKGKHGKENGSPTVVEEKQAPISSEKVNPVAASDQDVENLKPSPQAETKINGINGNVADDHGFEEQKGKKGRKKNKSRTSESHELNGKLENAQVITELNYEKDDLNKLGVEESTSEQSEVVPQPVQVNEVTSTEATEGNQRVFRENIKAVYDIDPSADPTAHPTQFAIQVQKLVESTLAASELKHADPNTKYSVQAQLLRLKEQDEQPKHTYTLRPLTPLAFERHVTVYTPSPRERSYKLLPKDILFCSYMIQTYGEDYEGMTKDAKNVYRENARSLQRKMRVFKESPHFETYKKAQETGRSVEEILQEEAAQA